VEFVPAGDAVAALNTLAGLKLPCDAEEAVENLRLEIEQFARDYWSLEPAERLAEWRNLTQRAGDAANGERLADLQAGLKLTVNALPDQATDSVAALARELFVLPARERAIRRNGWLLRNASRHNELMAEAQAIQREQPKLAALEPLLFARLSAHFDAPAFARGAKASPIEARAEASLEPIVYAPPQAAAPTPSKPERTRGSDGLPAWQWIVLFSFAVQMLIHVSGRMLVSGSLNTPPSTPTKPLPPPSGDNAVWDRTIAKMVAEDRTKPGPIMWYTSHEVDQFVKYDLNPSGPAPPLYVEWVNNGKPKAFQNIKRNPTQVSNGSPPANLPAKARFTPDQMRLYEDYERKPAGPAPAGYAEWVEAGRRKGSP
jgi:hypothetical protein